MNTLIYPGGEEFWPGLNNSNYRWMLLAPAHVPSTTHEFVADAQPDELTHGSYARQTLTGATRTPDLSAGTVTYDCADPSWVSLGGATAVGWAAMFRLVTNDADSPLMYLTRLDFTPVGSTFSPIVSGSGLHVHRFLVDCAAGTIG